MGAYIMLATIGVPCAIFLIYCLTPKGKDWLKHNNLL